MSNAQKDNASAATDIKDPIEAKLAKRDAMRAAGLNPYPHDFKRDAMAADLHKKYEGLADGSETEDQRFRGRTRHGRAQ